MKTWINVIEATCWDIQGLVYGNYVLFVEAHVWGQNFHNLESLFRVEAPCPGGVW